MNHIVHSVKRITFIYEDRRTIILNLHSRFAFMFSSEKCQYRKPFINNQIVRENNLHQNLFSNWRERSGKPCNILCTFNWEIMFPYMIYPNIKNIFVWLWKRTIHTQANKSAGEKMAESVDIFHYSWHFSTIARFFLASSVWHASFHLMYQWFSDLHLQLKIFIFENSPKFATHRK